MILGLACIRDLRILGADELHAGEAILSDDCVWGSLSSWAQSPVGLDDALYATDYPRCTHRI